MPLLLFALLFARFVSSQRIARAVTVASLPVGGELVAEAEQRLRTHGAELSRQKLHLILGAKEAFATPQELGLALGPNESARRAYGVARTGGAVANALRYLSSGFVSEDVAAVVHVDRALFDATISKLEPSLIDAAPFQGGIAFEKGTVVSQPPRAGRKIELEAALRACSEALATGHVGAPLTLTARTVTPTLASGSLEQAVELAQRALSQRVTLASGQRRLDVEPAELGSLLVATVKDQKLELGVDTARIEAWLAARRGSIEAPARDAGFEVSAQDEVKVTPSETGLKLVAADVGAALWAAAQSAEHRAELPLSHEPLPARSTEQAEKLGIHQLVGSFTTRHPCCQPRVDNIHRIATLLDGLTVEPGQTVSINDIVGPRTQKNGFVLAPSIEDGEMVDTVGGGVSQFATTIFNALFHAGYDIIERQPHTYWFPRYPMGHDATLGFPRPDIVFKNDTDAGLLIKTSFSKTTITVKLYGNVGGRRVTSAVSERHDIVQPAVELLPNREVPPDEEKVKEGGMIGWSVIASRTVIFADGTKKEEKRKVTYKPKPRRVEVHPCKIPKGEPGATGERCPEPEPEPAFEEPAGDAPAQSG